MYPAPTKRPRTLHQEKGSVSVKIPQKIMTMNGNALVCDKEPLVRITTTGVTTSEHAMTPSNSFRTIYLPSVRIFCGGNAISCAPVILKGSNGEVEPHHMVILTQPLCQGCTYYTTYGQT